MGIFFSLSVMLKVLKNCFGCQKNFSASFTHADVVCELCREKVFMHFSPLERIIACEEVFDQVTTCYSFYAYQNPIKNLILSAKVKDQEISAIWLADTLIQDEKIADFFASRKFKLAPQSWWSRLRGKYCFHEVFFLRLKNHVPDLNLKKVEIDKISWKQLYLKRSLEGKESVSPSYRRVDLLSKLPTDCFFDDIVTTGTTAAKHCKASGLWGANWLALCDAKRPYI